MDHKNEPSKPQAQQQPAADTNEQPKQSRREFVTRMARKTAYIAPVVIALSANRSAMASASIPS